MPTFRPDGYLEAGRPGWAGLVERLGEAAGTDASTYDGFLAALEARRRYFVDHGAVSSDHSHLDIGTEPMEPADARRMHALALRGEATPSEAARLPAPPAAPDGPDGLDDGLVMTLHPGSLRGHHDPTTRRFGADTGHDIPVTAEYTRALRPLLERYGTHPGFHLVLFTLDETVFSRELAPLAGFYPSVFVGAPWWFLDTPERHPRLPARGHRDGGLQPDCPGSSTTPGRSARSRPGTTCRAASTPASSPGWSPSTGSTSTRRWRPSRGLVADQPRRVFKL